MKEIIEAAFSPVNIIPTILLLFVLFYWIIVIVGVINMDFLDVDVDMDADIDLDVDVDADIDVDTDMDIDAHTDIDPGASISWLNHVLVFFGLGFNTENTING